MNNLYSETINQRRTWGDKDLPDLSSQPLLKPGDVISHYRLAFCHSAGKDRWKVADKPLGTAAAGAENARLEKWLDAERLLSEMSEHYTGHWGTAPEFEALLDSLQKFRLGAQNRLSGQNYDRYYREELDNRRFVVTNTEWVRDFCGGRNPFFLVYSVRCKPLGDGDVYDPSAPDVLFSQSADSYFATDGFKSMLNDPILHGHIDLPF
jgi:hypothetical protein